MESPYSQGSEGSTSDLNEPESPSPDTPKSMPPAGKSSPTDGPESPPGQMSEMSQDQESLFPTTSESSSEGSPARTSPSRGKGAASRASGAGSSSKPAGSPTLFSETEDGSSLRTYPDSFHPTEAEISESFSRRWPNSGFTTSPTEFWTADTSECPSDGDGSSSLLDVLEATVPERFYLSPKAAAGILRRAAKRGKELPTRLREALEALAGQ